MILDLRVVKRTEDGKKGKYVIFLEGKSADVLSNALVDVELKISAKTEEIMDSFPMNQPIFFKMSPKKESE